jgi:MerR family mercuric resistance operon transcriptional regulator
LFFKLFIIRKLGTQKITKKACFRQPRFNLSEIATLLELGDGKCMETKQLATDKLETITSKINDLQLIAKTLETLVNCCDDNSSQQGCPIISSISKK